MSQYNLIKTLNILCGKFPYFSDVKIVNMSYEKKIPFSENRSCVVSVGRGHKETQQQITLNCLAAAKQSSNVDFAILSVMILKELIHEVFKS